jgi:IclR family transcriptional regulator, KDG regulon repressor
LKTISKALKIIELLSYKKMNTKEIASDLGINKSTASRILSTLRKKNFIKLDRDKKYIIGYAIFEITNRFLNTVELVSVAKPYLQKLYEKTKESIHLGVIDRGEIIYLYKIESEHPIRMYSSVGKRVISYCTGLGKAILAYLPEKELESIVKNIEFKKFTENTIPDKDRLIAELKKIREKGIAYDNGEHEEGIFCIACPIFNIYDEVIASISVTAMFKYKSMDDLKKFENDIKETSLKISREFGYCESNILKHT